MHRYDCAQLLHQEPGLGNGHFLKQIPQVDIKVSCAIKLLLLVFKYCMHHICRTKEEHNSGGKCIV